jgi:hypothetical protein
VIGESSKVSTTPANFTANEKRSTAAREGVQEFKEFKEFKLAQGTELQE